MLSSSSAPAWECIPLGMLSLNKRRVTLHLTALQNDGEMTPFDKLRIQLYAVDRFTSVNVWTPLTLKE